MDNCIYTEGIEEYIEEHYEEKICKKCGVKFAGYKEGIDCSMCEEWFCDNCYDYEKLDGCFAHGGGVYASMDGTV